MAETETNRTIEVRGFGKLSQVFRERHWSFPFVFEIDNKVTCSELLDHLGIARDQVEAIMVNGKVLSFDKTISPGDRVALVPPGTPGPYRVLLGFVERK